MAPQIQALEASFEKYRIIEIDIPRFKENILSQKGTRILWKIDGDTEYDMNLYPEEIRSPDFQASIVSDNNVIKKEESEIVAQKDDVKVSTLSKGIYFLKIVGRGINEAHKVIIE